MEKAFVLFSAFFLLLSNFAYAGSATWNASPASGDWNTPANWTPAAVPNGPGDIASFGISSINALSLRTNIELDSMVFDSVGGTSTSYTISTGPAATLTFSGAGIVNNSAGPQSILLPDVNGAQMVVFHNEATITGTVYITNDGYGGTTGADIEFRDKSSAGDGSFTNNGFIFFFDHASAGRGYFVNNPPRAAGQSPSVTYFSYFGFDGAENASFINNGSATSGQLGGATQFSSAGDFGRSTVVCYGGTVRGAGGGFIEVDHLAHVENVTFTAFGGTNGGAGGNLQMYGPHADNASVQIYGNSTMDMSGGGNMRIGTLQGEGKIFLAADWLIIGSDKDSSFAGTIQNHGGSIDGDGGGLVKSGAGRLVLKNANLYDGGTVVSSGMLIVNNTTGSGTGTGKVNVKGGILSGIGTISGTVTIGKGDGTGAQLAPGTTPVKIGTLAIQAALTFSSDATYRCGIDSDASAADEVAASGAAITEGAQFALTDRGTSTLGAGTALTVINNTAATAINGTFSNLPDGSTITVGSNTFQANYEGGDGNDLALTVL
jgi:autotransporter-associated beta strand protein